MLNAYLWVLMIASYITTVIYAYDKSLVETGAGRRVSEFALLIPTALGGAFGALVGTILFNHKANVSKKWYYLLTLIASIVVQLMVLLLLLEVISF